MHLENESAIVSKRGPEYMASSSIGLLQVIKTVG